MLGNKEILSNNLNKYIDMSKKSKAQIANDLNIPLTTFYDWCNGVTYPRIDNLQALADYFGILKSDLSEDKEKIKDHKKSILNKFKLYEDPVSAGRGSWLDDGCEYNYVEIEHPSVKADFALRVRGDSMMPLYNDNDIVFVRANVIVEPGQVGIFALNGEGYLKQWQGNKLVSFNPSYEPIFIHEDDEFITIGRVVEKSEHKNE